MSRVVALWAGPRTGSTATMYSFAQRHDTRVMDEPLFGHFLRHTGVMRPSRQEVLSTMDVDAESALQSIEPKGSDEVLFLKHMANHVEGITWENLDSPQHMHVVLTRHPDGVIPSYAAHLTSPTMLDLCYAHQLDIVEAVGTRATVILAEDLFSKPRETLQSLCDKLELPWDESMLHWQAGGRPEDGLWAKYWYHGVHASTGWESRELKVQAPPLHLAELRNECMKLYLSMKSNALIV